MKCRVLYKRVWIPTLQNYNPIFPIFTQIRIKMSYRHTLEAALESLQDIEELIKGFPENGDVPSIELDLSLQKLRNIYELLLILKRPMDYGPAETTAPGSESIAQPSAPPSAPQSAQPSAPPSAPQSAQPSAPPEAPPSAPPSAPPEAPVAGPVSAPSSVRSVNTAVEIQVEREVKETIRTSETIIEPPKKPPLSHRESAEAQILSDRFKGRATLHETLHQSMGKDSQFHAQGKPVENLMSAIAINDRFTFIRELFNGDTSAFEYAIKSLNEAANFNDAYNYMMQNYDWDMDSEAVQLLLDIIRRKYIISRHE